MENKMKPKKHCQMNYNNNNIDDQLLKERKLMK